MEATSTNGSLSVDEFKLLAGTDLIINMLRNRLHITGAGPNFEITEKFPEMFGGLYYAELIPQSGSIWLYFEDRGDMAKLVVLIHHENKNTDS